MAGAGSGRALTADLFGGGSTRECSSDPGAAPTVAAAKWRERYRSARSEDETCAALGHLAAAEGASAVETILEAFRSAKRPYVRECAVNALGETEAPSAANWLAEIARGPERELMEPAMQALAKNGSGAARSALLEFAHGDDPRLRQQALLSMGNAGWPEAAPLIVGALEHATPRSKEDLLSALGATRNPAAVPFLMKLAQEDGFSNREAAFDALGEMGGPEAIAFLTKEAGGQKPRYAIDALARIQDESARSALLELARTPGKAQVKAMHALMARATTEDPRVREEVRANLLRMVGEGGKNGDAALNALSQDESPEGTKALASIASGGGNYASEAIRRLAGLDDPSVAPVLLRAFESGKEDVRGPALSGLADLGGPMAERALADAVRSHDPKIRKEAASALVGSGLSGAKSWLETLSRDSNRDVADAARATIVIGRGGDDADDESTDRPLGTSVIAQADGPDDSSADDESPDKLQAELRPEGRFVPCAR
ncbi:HEAT repeat domain-containing protein [Pendulispora albinea]|uniref:HEAT repeat domain-containing protein n=1 Tax=Pendulispora albinea TaxID=2741071 RepID=A0ABZ2LZQ7_9BACT